MFSLGPKELADDVLAYSSLTMNINFFLKAYPFRLSLVYNSHTGIYLHYPSLA